MVSLPFLASSLTSSSVHLLLFIELFLNRKKTTMEMVYIFFLFFVRSIFFMCFFTGLNPEVIFILSFLKRTSIFLLIFSDI